jgi:PAS domain S-box-containing protein
LKLRSIIEQSRDGIMLTDEGGVIIEYNKGAEAIFGLSRDKVIGMYIWDFQALDDISLHNNPDRFAKVKSMILEALKTGLLTGASHLRETSITCPDSTLKTIQVSNFLIKTEKGCMICGIIRDITEQKHSEQAIRDSEEKLRSVIEQSLDGIMLVDNAGTIIEFSKGVEHITGMNAKNIIGKKLWETEFVPFVSGEYNSNYRTEAGINNLKKFILEYVKTGISPFGVTSFELTFIRPDKEKRVVLLNYSPIRSEKGNMICMIARDITERKREEEELHKAEETYRSLVELINDGVWEVDRNLVVTYVNPQIYTKLGLREEDIVGKGLMDILSPKETELFSKNIMPILATRKPFKRVVLSFVRGNHREITAEVTGIPIIDEKGEYQGYRGVARDVTDRQLQKAD